MRLSYILLVAASAFVATVDANDVAPSKPNMLSVVDSMPAVKSTDRFLRVHKKSKYEEDDDGDDA
ncbi:hypothetical protein P3T76_004127 [Phytophthora citrophthora]|uniref:RxLR effector protein n=1 Tax=Phytophthora citrophthora TaxID=4793 RepID=A0AAD9GSW3_9STRA|nr:hypothetical protein P3T76_004127 [Phytophthora citrophthora]